MHSVVEFFSQEVRPPDTGMIQAITTTAVHLGHCITRTRAEQGLLHQALHDGLTGLPNRTLFNDRLEQVLGLNNQ